MSMHWCISLLLPSSPVSYLTTHCCPDKLPLVLARVPSAGSKKKSSRWLADISGKVGVDHFLDERTEASAKEKPKSMYFPGMTDLVKYFIARGQLHSTRGAFV